MGVKRRSQKRKAAMAGIKTGQQRDHGDQAGAVVKRKGKRDMRERKMDAHNLLLWVSAMTGEPTWKRKDCREFLLVLGGREKGEQGETRRERGAHDPAMISREGARCSCESNQHRRESNRGECCGDGNRQRAEDRRAESYDDAGVRRSL